MKITPTLTLTRMERGYFTPSLSRGGSGRGWGKEGIFGAKFSCRRVERDKEA